MGVLGRLVVAILAIVFLPGCCLMLGNTQSARTLEKGTGEVGMTFGATSYQFETTTVDPNTGNPEKENLTVTYPVMIPEIPFGVAVTDDVTIGGRVAPQSLGLEGNVKWRFFHADRLHMAIMPSFNYQSWLLVQGVGARLPLLVTYDLNDNFAFTTAINAAYSDWSFADEDFEPDDDDEGQAVWNGSIASFGMSAGMEIHTESFFLRPAIEFNRYQQNFNDDFEDSFEPFNSVGFMINIGFVIGKTKKQLDRMEQKLDRALENRQPPPSPPPPDSPPPPPPPEGQAAIRPPGDPERLIASP